MRFALLRPLGAWWAAVAVLSAAPLPPAPPGTFSVVVLPDSQMYVGAGTKRTPRSLDPIANFPLAAQIDWLVANLAAQRVAFVTHVGEIVEDDREPEWEVAARLLRPLHGRVPYGLCLGNHDMDPDGTATLFQRFFPAARFRELPWYAGSFEPGRPGQVSGNNVNSCQLFSAGGLDFVHLSLECNAPDDVLAWAGEQLRRHSGRLALISTHMDLGVIDKPAGPGREGYSRDPQGRMRWVKRHGARGNTAEQMLAKLYRHHVNLRFVFSGDQSNVTALHLPSVGDYGNTVHHCLSDYGSLGPLRLYRFHPAANRVEAITYDPVKVELVRSTHYKPGAASHQFELAVDLRAPVGASRP